MSGDFSDPPPESLEFAHLLQEHREELIDRCARHIIGMAEGTYAHIPFEEIRPRTAVGYEAFHRSFAEDPSSYAAFWEKLAQDRVRQGYAIKDVQDAISAVRHIVSEFIAENYAADPETMLTVIRLADDIHDSARMALSVVYITALEEAVAERKRAEEALAEEHYLLRTLLNTLPDHIYIKDTESRFVIGNIATARSVGATTPDEIVGKTDFDFHPQELAAQYYADEQAIIQSGQELTDHEEPAVDPSGDQRWFSSTKVPLRDRQGKIIGLVGMNRDITQHKQAEDKLRKAYDELERRVEERTAELSKANAILKEQIAERRQAEEALAQERDLLHTLMDNMPDFIFFKDAQSRFIRTNRAHAQIMGLTDPQEVVGKTDFDLFPQEDAQRFYDEEQQIMQSRQPVISRVWQIPTKEGDVIWVSETKVPLLDEAGQVVGLVGISRDITERKQAEEITHMQREIIEAQRRALWELSTPIVPVLEGVLVLPLVGGIDNRRAQQIMETLLEAIGHYQAAVVIIDITGVPMVDTEVANHILQVTRASALLGSECVLVGISPEVAQTIVSLGVDLSSIITQANLQSGIEYALKKTKWRMVKG